MLENTRSGWSIISLLLALQLLAVWVPESYPTVDGPPKIYLTSVLHELSRDPAAPASVYFEENWDFVPNLTAYGVIFATTPFFSPDVVEKILVSLLIAVLPFAFFYAARPLGARTLTVFILAAPLQFCTVLQIGLFNLAYSLIPFLIALGWWLRMAKGERARWWDYLWLAFLAIAAYATHIFGASELLLVIAVAAPTAALMKHRRERAGKESATLAQVAWPVLIVGLSLLPVFLLILQMSFAQQADPFYDRLPQRDFLTSIFQKAVDLLSGRFAVAYSQADQILMIIAQSAIAFAIYHRLREGRKGGERSFLITALGAALIGQLAVLFLLPTEIGGSSTVIPRHMIFIYAVMVLWLAARYPSGQIGRVFLSAVLVVSVCFAFLRGYQAIRFNELRNDYAFAAQFIEEDATLIAMKAGVRDNGNFFWTPAGEVFPLLHESSRIAMARGAIDLGLVQARGERPLVPLQFQAGKGPFEIAYRPDPPISYHAHDIDPLAYEDETGVRVDYLLITGTNAPYAKDRFEAYRNRLLKRYEDLGTSPSGLVQVFGHKKR